MSPREDGNQGASGLPATLGELLNGVETELDALSIALSRGAGPDPLLVARQWPALRRAGTHLLGGLAELTVKNGGAPNVTNAAAHAARALRELDAASRSTDPAPALGDHRREGADGALARAARALGAAGDLARSVHSTDYARVDVNAASLACSALVTVAGQVTTHATIHDLRTLRTAQEASAVAAITGEVLGMERQGDRRPSLDLFTVRTRPEPRPGDAIRALEVATWDWRTASLQAAERVAPSSRDLRVTLAGASQLMGVSTLALQAASQLHQRTLLTSQHPDADQLRSSVQRADLELARKMRTAMIDCTAAASVWNGHSTGTPGTPELLSATSALTTAVSLAVRDGGRWLTPGELGDRVDPLALALAARSTVDAVRDVLRAHHDVVERLLRHEQVYVAARTLSPVTAHPGYEDLPTKVQDELALERMQQVRNGAWVPATWGEYSGPLMDAYAPLQDLTSRVRTGYWSATSHLEDPTWRRLMEAVAERGTRTHAAANPGRASPGSGPVRGQPEGAAARAQPPLGPREISRSELQRRLTELQTRPDEDNPKPPQPSTPAPRHGPNRR